MYDKETYNKQFVGIDFRKHPEKYKIGIGEQGVLLAQPYKGEILPYWKFATPEDAEKSSKKIYSMFKSYLSRNDFVGADMARKFLQMGWTRSRRYANHSSGKKYRGAVPEDKKGQSGAHGRSKLPDSPDSEKAKSASIFFEKYMLAAHNEKYVRMKKDFKEKYNK